MAINDSLSAHAPRTLPDLTDAATRFPVRAGEDPWTEQEVQEIATELVAEIDRLTAELAAADEELSNLLRNSGDGAGDDQADSGSSALEREHELTLVNNTRDMLEQTTRALARIDAGTFGRCDSCGEAIGKARVQAFPRATLCVACKQREERR
ncbi:MULTISPECIES: TraR/DksA family transcriptional regulator [unclassified Cellulomonas]|uniref:TraR/DksA family transcriptional regulator n=1 Tax=unclassified Cellulomonas TaxID=2620175 RepID=UPI0019B22D0A|nr:TraR/DksA family transcriptional regulator [Cellulomonas sp. ES6]MBD3778349.1 TraR/DksA family transcriptional regulator [Micrococcales bacterium]WHP17565.1 TraR/DksA family transcriptional regulator [Cellulomonas sp. ES6]